MSVVPPARSFDIPADSAAPSVRPAALRRYPLLLALVIALGAVFLLATSLPNIAARHYVDPDDLVRLQEVRDWMAGQSWFDVTQYRINPPAGMPMHWSRLVDVPIAAVILIVRPFAGQAGAELAASVIVPLITFACLAGLAAAIARRVTGSDRLALLAAGLATIDCGVIAVSPPMRIDHHGWQAVCALAMVLALIGRGWRPAAIAGGFAALWMHISLEGALFTVACGGWLGLSWIVAPRDEQARLPAYLGAVTVGSFALFLIAHGGALFERNFADAISPIHLIVFALATMGSAASLRLAARGMAWRCAGLGLTALVAAAVYKLFGPQHADNPFAALGPLSYRLWYLQIAEGLPLWKLPLQMAAIMVGYPLIALACVAMKVRSAAAETRRILIVYGVLLAAATLIGIVLQRASYAANLIALPGGVLLMAELWQRAMALRLGAIRIVAAVGAIMLSSPASPGMAALILIPYAHHRASAADARLARTSEACNSLGNLAHLDAIAPSLFLTPISTAEALIVASRHSSVAAGYHRVPDALEDSIRFFTSAPDAAHAVALRRHAAYVLLCPGDGAAMLYTRTAPDGLAAQLTADRPPAWLRPVTVPGLRFARVYRVID
jgi:hypothetical protein